MLVVDGIVRFQVVEVDMSVLCRSCVLENVGGIINKNVTINPRYITAHTHIKEDCNKKRTKESETHSTLTYGC